MFNAAFDWARKRGLDRIEGPRGFTVFDGLGMLVRGFEHRPAFGLPYNLPYYPQLVEAAGFSSKIELVSGYLDRGMRFPEKVHRAAELIKRRRELRVIRYRTRQELKELAPYLKDLYNSSFAPGEDNIPLTDADVKTLASQMMWFADPRLIKIVMKEDKPVGFLFAYPDISRLYSGCRAGYTLSVGSYCCWSYGRRSGSISMEPAYCRAITEQVVRRYYLTKCIKACLKAVTGSLILYRSV